MEMDISLYLIRK